MTPSAGTAVWRVAGDDIWLSGLMECGVGGNVSSPKSLLFTLMSHIVFTLRGSHRECARSKCWPCV